MRDCIFVLPEFDEASKYSHLWGIRLIEQVKDKINVILLEKEDATREKFEETIAKYPQADICFENHGSEDCLCAQGGESCVLDTKNVDKVAGKIIFTMACLSAAKLGAVAYVNYGCVYVGYVKEFAFITDDEELFCYAANSGFIAHVNGEKDWAKIKQIMIDAFNEAIAKTENPWSRVWLSWDRDNLRIYAEGVDTPETKCAFRKLAIKIFGPKIGWRISRKHALGWIFYLVGFGITLHAVASELYHKGGYAEILKPQGEYVGLALTFAGFILLNYEVFKLLRK